MKFPDSELWNYATQIYQIPEVEGSCLELQNQYDADVNILLYCCWVSEQKHRLSGEDIQILQTTTAPWQTILKPLRDARQMMKQHIILIPSEQQNQTIDNMSEIELNAEHMAQLALEGCLDISQREREAEMSAADCCAQNIYTYLQQLEGVKSISDISEPVSQLLSAIYEDEEAVQMALMMAATG